MKISRLSVLLALAGACLFSSRAPAQTEEIKVGVILGLGGPMAGAGEDMRDGALLAIEQLKQDGRPNLALVIEDHQWDTKRAVAAFWKLLKADHAALYYTVGSSITLALKPLTEKSGVLLFTTASHPQVTSHSTLVLRHSNLADRDAAALAGEAARHVSRRALVIAMQDEWALGYAEQFKATLTQLAPEAAVRVEEHLPQLDDFRPLLLKNAAWEPEIIVVASYGPQTVQLLEQIRELSIPAQVLVSNVFSISPEAVALAKEKSLCGFYYQDYEPPPSDFTRIFKKRFQRDPGPIALVSYTDMELLTSAVRAVGADPGRIAAYVKKLGAFQCRFERLDISANGDMPIPTVIKKWGHRAFQ